VIALIFISDSPIEGVVFGEIARREGIECVQSAHFGLIGGIERVPGIPAACFEPLEAFPTASATCREG